MKSCLNCMYLVDSSDVTCFTFCKKFNPYKVGEEKLAVFNNYLDESIKADDNEMEINIDCKYHKSNEE